MVPLVDFCLDKRYTIYKWKLFPFTPLEIKLCPKRRNRLMNLYISAYHVRIGFQSPTKFSHGV